jgi:hypothetical protein
MPLPLSHVIGDSTPCRLRETGCAGGNVIGVILLALLVAGVVVSVLAWIGFDGNAAHSRPSCAC